MADVTKVLGQSNPLAGTLTNMYTVPALTSTVASTISIANRSATPTVFRCSIAIAGAADANAQYLYYDITIPGNDTFAATLGYTMGAADVFRVYAAAATLSFSLFGIESA